MIYSGVVLSTGWFQYDSVCFSVSRQTHERLEPTDEALTTDGFHDYGDTSFRPISVPSFELVVTPGEKYYVFKIHYDDQFICSRRYSEFVDLHNALKVEFVDFKFPKLPGKWPFQMNEQQIEQRRRGLESYLQKVISVKVIAAFEAMQEFVALESNSSVDDVPMKSHVSPNSLECVNLYFLNSKPVP